MNWRGRTVAKGPWAGWTITSARAVCIDIGMLPNGKAGTVEYRGPFKCTCKLEDPRNLLCTGSGVVLMEKDLVPLSTSTRRALLDT